MKQLSVGLDSNFSSRSPLLRWVSGVGLVGPTTFATRKRHFLLSSLYVSKKRYGNEKNFIFWCIIFFTFTTDELYTFDDVSSFFPYRKHHLMLMGLPHFHITISDLELTRLPHEPRPVFPSGGQGVVPGGSRNSC